MHDAVESIVIQARAQIDCNTEARTQNEWKVELEAKSGKPN